MRDNTLVKMFEAQEKDNRFFSAGIVTIAASQQAWENLMGRWGMLPLLLVSSLVYPPLVRKLLKRETEKVRRPNNGTVTPVE